MKPSKPSKPSRPTIDSNVPDAVSLTVEPVAEKREMPPSAETNEDLFALRLENVVKKLDKKDILKNVSLSVARGEVFGFLGPNGAGKTTTMKCVLGLISQNSGSVRVLGREWLDLESKKRIGFMPENTYLYKYLTGREFLRFNGKFFDIPSDVLESRIDELLVKVGLEKAGDRLLSKYSKGMLQRVGLAQAIVNEPEIVFLDEPMSGLDPLGRRMVKDLILELKAKGATVFFNTHILSDVESICDHFAIIHRGSIVDDGYVKDLRESLEERFIAKVTEGGLDDHEIR